MKGDVGSNYTLDTEDVGHATGAAVNSTAVDHNLAPSCSFQVECISTGTSLDMKLQHSPDNSTWTDDDGASGNDTAITQLTAAGRGQIDVPNPQARYSRVVATSVGATVAVLATVYGPLRHVAP